jgi:hypothetical protein
MDHDPSHAIVHATCVLSAPASSYLLEAERIHDDHALRVAAGHRADCGGDWDRWMERWTTGEDERNDSGGDRGEAWSTEREGAREHLLQRG